MTPADEIIIQQLQHTIWELHLLDYWNCAQLEPAPALTVDALKNEILVLAQQLNGVQVIEVQNIQFTDATIDTAFVADGDGWMQIQARGWDIQIGDEAAGEPPHPSSVI